MLRKIEGNILRIELSNPPLNLLTLNDVKELEDILLRNKNQVILIISGEGNNFSYGLDYKEFSGLSSEDIESRLRYIKRVFNLLRLFNGFVISAVEGIALDEGFELMLMSDYIIAKPTVRLGYSKDRVRYPISLGGFRRIISKAGETLLYKILFEGGTISGEYAYSNRLIEFIDDDPLGYAYKLADYFIMIYGEEGIRNIKSLLKEKYVHYDSILLSIEDTLLERTVLQYELSSLFTNLRHIL